jgi:protein-tyrosine-phosphatase
MKNTRVLFVCTGNIYRSRLAEAYLRSLQLPQLTITSCGTEATVQHKGPILWTTLRLLYRHNLLPFMTRAWKQITTNDLQTSDIAVFLDRKNYEYCRNRFPLPKKYEIWSLPDFNERDLNGKPVDLHREIECIMLSEKTFELIKEKVNQLIRKYHLDSTK